MEYGLSLNSDVMHLILGYLDPVDCAKMAKVSHGWRKFIYRAPVWNRFNWRVTTDYKVLGITDKSVHCGVKRRDCFWNWASRNYKFRDGGVLSVHALWRIWHKQGRPCLSLYHHIPETCFLYSLTDTEKSHFLKHHVLYGSPHINPYYQFVSRMSRIVWSDNGGRTPIHWTEEIQYLKSILTTRETVAPKDRTQSDRFEIRLLYLDIAELQLVVDEFYRIYNVYRKSLNKLCLITNDSFRQNHQQIIKHNNNIWNNIIFSLSPV